MERRDESIVWDQYATYVAADGSFLTPQPDPAFRSFGARVRTAIREPSAAIPRAPQAPFLDQNFER